MLSLLDTKHKVPCVIEIGRFIKFVSSSINSGSCSSSSIVKGGILGSVLVSLAFSNSSDNTSDEVYPSSLEFYSSFPSYRELVELY